MIATCSGIDVLYGRVNRNMPASLSPVEIVKTGYSGCRRCENDYLGTKYIARKDESKRILSYSTYE
jgi:hypothetical protein